MKSRSRINKALGMVKVGWREVTMRRSRGFRAEKPAKNPFSPFLETSSVIFRENKVIADKKIPHPEDDEVLYQKTLNFPETRCSQSLCKLTAEMD